jgi:hypothetical protein
MSSKDLRPVSVTIIPSTHRVANLATILRDLAISSRLLSVHANAKVFHHKQESGDERKHTGDPDRNGKSEQKIQAKDNKEECEKNMGHGRSGLGFFSIRFVSSSTTRMSRN